MRQRFNGRAQDVPSSMLVEFSAVLLQLQQLRLALKSVQQEHTTAFRKAHSGGRGRSCRLSGFIIPGNLLHACRALGLALLVVLFRGWPINQTVRNSFPGETLGAVIAHAASRKL